MTIADINSRLGLKSIEEMRILEDTLKAMEKEATIYYSAKKKKYTLFENSHLVKGKLSLSSKGYGFVIVEGRDKDIYIHKSNINGANDGDFVCVEITDNSLVRAGDSVVRVSRLTIAVSS